MASIEIPQADADYLLSVEKHRISSKPVAFPPKGGRIALPLVSHDGRNQFQLTAVRGYIKIEQASYQTIAHSAIVLARLDIDGPPHTNPDGEEFPCPHLHVYREGYGTKWAKALPKDVFSDTTNLYVSLIEFMRFCNVTQLPLIQSVLV